VAALSDIGGKAVRVSRSMRIVRTEGKRSRRRKRIRAPRLSALGPYGIDVRAPTEKVEGVGWRVKEGDGVRREIEPNTACQTQRT